MDDHHYQPIWPMVQGAFDYIMNLLGEAWSMVWKPTPEPREECSNAGQKREPVDPAVNNSSSGRPQAARASMRELLNFAEAESRLARSCLLVQSKLVTSRLAKSRLPLSRSRKSKSKLSRNTLPRLSLVLD